VSDIYEREKEELLVDVKARTLEDYFDEKVGTENDQLIGNFIDSSCRLSIFLIKNLLSFIFLLSLDFLIPRISRYTVSFNKPPLIQELIL